MNNTDWADYQRQQENAYYAEKENRECRDDDEVGQAAPAKAGQDGAGGTGFGMVSGIAALGFAGLLIVSIAQVFGPFFGASASAAPVFKHSMASFLILAAALHLVLIISRRNRLSAWPSVPLLFFYGVAQVGVLDGLRGGTARPDLLRLAMVCTFAMGLWLIACFLYRFIVAHVRDEVRHKERDARLVAANNAVLDDANEGKDGEQRVHDALELAVRRQFGAEAVVIQRGGLLPIEGRIASSLWRPRTGSGNAYLPCLATRASSNDVDRAGLNDSRTRMVRHHASPTTCDGLWASVVACRSNSLCASPAAKPNWLQASRAV